jgi:hypothetical protein
MRPPEFFASIAVMRPFFGRAQRMAMPSSQNPVIVWTAIPVMEKMVMSAWALNR